MRARLLAAGRSLGTRIDVLLTNRIAWYAGAALVFVFNALKFVHLTADFPSGVTSSRALYTDEGWYSAAAVTRGLGASLYTPGELNTIVNLPIGALLQAGVFDMVGVSLSAARALVATFSIVLVASAFLLARRYVSRRAALLLTVLLTVNFFLFAYSRLAILDMLATTLAVVALTVAASTEADAYVLSGLAGAVLGIAILTKTTATCVLPAVVYLSASKAEDRRKAFALAACSSAVALAIAGGYSLLAWRLFPVDFEFFEEFAAGFALASGPLAFARNFAVALFNTVSAHRLIVPVALGLTVTVWRVSGAFRRNALVHASLLWVVTFLLMVSVVSYQPSRYFTLVLIPTLTLIALAIADLGSVISDRRVLRLAQAGIVGLIVTVNGVEISRYMIHPHFSFSTMANEVAETVERDGQGDPRVLLGDMAGSVSLATGVPSISLTATGELAGRLRRHCPAYYITLQDSEELATDVLRDTYDLEHVKSWDVFGNYYLNRPVQLFRLRSHDGVLDACAAKTGGGEVARTRRQGRLARLFGRKPPRLRPGA